MQFPCNINQIIDNFNDLTAPVLSFAIYQCIRSSSNSTATAGTFTYATDRWYVYCVDGGCSYSQSGGTSTETSLEVLPDSETTNQIIAQKIENIYCLELGGKTVTISGKVYIDDATGVTFNTNVYSASQQTQVIGTRTFSSTW